MPNRADLTQQVLDAQIEIFRNIQAEAAPVWCDLELTMAQLKAFVVIGHDGPLAVSAVAEAMGTGRPAASAVVDRLVNVGLVVRAEDATDRRRTNVQLTDAGSELAMKLQRGHDDVLGGWLELLEEEDLAALARGLTALAEATRRHNLRIGGAQTHVHPQAYAKESPFG